VELLSLVRVLVEERQGTLLVFAHHVLFDYTTFRLLLPVESSELSVYLAKDPQQALLILPSLDFYFRALWQISPTHDEHWRTEFRCIQTEDVPEVAKLIGPSIAAELATGMSDLEELRNALASPDQQSRQTAERAFEHLVGALTVGAPAATDHPRGSFQAARSERAQKRDLELRGHRQFPGLQHRGDCGREKLVDENRKKPALQSAERVKCRGRLAAQTHRYRAR
jgi:hypothetical protein